MPLGGSVYWLGWWFVLMDVEELVNVVGHGYIYKAVMVVPIDGEATVLLTCPVNSNCIFVL
jgi:hypothetical protein